MFDPLLHATRRHFFRDCAVGVGSMAMSACIANEPYPSDAQPKDGAPKKLLVEDVMKSFKLEESKIEYQDEPPGKLREVSWAKAKLPGTEIDVAVSLKVVYTTSVFSAERKWDAKAVRAATVIEVKIEPWINNAVPRD